MAQNISPRNSSPSIGALPPFKYGDISDPGELMRLVDDSRGYDVREKSRDKRIKRLEPPELFHLPRQALMADQLSHFATQYVIDPQTPESPPPGSLPDIYALDVVFVALDFEGPLPHKPFEIGIATLDTRDLMSTGKSPSLLPAEIIKSRHFAMGYRRNRHKSHPKFLFGETEYLKPNSVNTRSSVLMESLFIRDEQPNHCAPNSFRNIVLVGHQLYIELDTMSSLGIRAEAFGHVVGMLDTEKVARNLLGLNAYPSLRDLLLTFYCPYSRLHNAGNDATFTLRILLMMAAKLGQMSALSSLENQRVARLEEIARAPLPSMVKEPPLTVFHREPRIAWKRAHRAWKRENPLNGLEDPEDCFDMMRGLELD